MAEEIKYGLLSKPGNYDLGTSEMHSSVLHRQDIDIFIYNIVVVLRLV